MISRKLASLTTPVLAIVAVSCGGSDETKESTSSTPTQAHERPFTDEEARAAAQALLAAIEDDMPPSWTKLPADEDGGPTPTVPELQGECAGISLEKGQEPGQVVSLDSSKYGSPDKKVEVQFTADVFEDDDSAGEALAKARRLAGDCADQFTQLFLEAVRNEVENATPGPGETPIDLRVTDLKYQELPFKNLGDESGLFRLTTSFTVAGREFATYLDLVGVRVGNVVGSFSYQTTFDPPEISGEEEFAARVHEHTRQGAESLK
ncbi:MAG: hypothetical protein E6J42_11140 [Chloroflexi bacterium]|nr:MAG: hypothetical protein E6J42_11140 [Chloroflexota bacterium]